MSLALLLILLSCAPSTNKRVQAQVTPTQSPPTEASQGVRPSSGCTRPAPQSPPTTLTVDGRNRSLIAALPEGYDPTVPHDMVIAFHGLTNSNERVRRYYGLEQDAPNTLFLYPSGLRSGSTYSWSDPGDPSDNLRDYELFDAMLSTYAADYCLDLNRIFVVGHSLGAWFANSLACARGAEVRGAGTLGGGVSSSACTGEVAAIVFHNPNDRLVPFSQGEAARDAFIKQGGLSTVSVAGEPRAFRCQRYGPPGTRNPVVWCPHTFDYGYNGRYYPHNWPEGTGAAIMNFFASLP